MCILQHIHLWPKHLCLESSYQRTELKVERLFTCFFERSSGNWNWKTKKQVKGVVTYWIIYARIHSQESSQTFIFLQLEEFVPLCSIPFIPLQTTCSSLTNCDKKFCTHSFHIDNWRFWVSNIMRSTIVQSIVTLKLA